MAKEAAAAKPAKPAEPAAAEKPAEKKGTLKVIIIAAAVLLLEGGTIGATMMLNKGPRPASAEIPTTAPAAPVEKDVEVLLVKAKLPNNQSGHLFLYDLQVVAKVSEKNKEKLADLMTDRAAAVQDRIRTILASSDPKSLSEPGLETLRRQIGYQLEQDLGKDLIKELLIPTCTPFRSEF